MLPFDRVFADEDFSTVDPSLTPDPFGTVTAAGSNSASAGAFGPGGNTAMKVDFNGTASTCYCIHTLASSMLATRGIIKFGLQAKVVDSGLAAGEKLGLMIVRSGGTELIRVYWVTDTDTSKGFLRVEVNYGTPGNIDTALINEDTYFSLEFVVLADGSVEVTLNDNVISTYDPGARPSDPNILRIGTSIADAIPAGTAEYIITRYYATQWYHRPEHSPVARNEGTNLINGAILCGAPGGVF